MFMNLYNKIGVGFFFLILVSCDMNQEGLSLDMVDSLIVQEHYDSAYRLFQTIDSSTLDMESKARYELLRVQTDYVTYHKQKSDSLLDGPIDYYKGTDTEKLAECYYYKGACMYENGQIIEAAKYLKLAEQESRKTSNPRLKYKVCSTLIDINRSSGNYNLELSYAEKALDIAEKAGKKPWAVNSMYQLCLAYFNLNDSINALETAKRLESMIDYAEEGTHAYIYNCLGVIFEDYDRERARQCFVKSLSYKPFANTYEYLADLALKDGDHELAHYYWERAISLDDDSAPKDVLLYNLLQYDIRHGKIEDICPRILRIYQIKDSVYKARTDKSVLELQNEFDTETKVREHEMKELTWISIASLFIAISLLLTLIIYIIRNKARRKMDSQQKTITSFTSEIQQLRTHQQADEQQILTLNRVISDYKSQLRIIQESDSENRHIADLESKITYYSEEINNLKKDNADKVNKIEVLRERFNNWLHEQSDMLSRGYILFKEINDNKSTVKWSTSDLESLTSFFRVARIEEYEKISKSYGKLTNHNLLFLILIHIGKSESEIREIMGIGQGAIRSIRHRLKKKQ